MKNFNHTELVKSAQTGNITALETLYIEHSKRVYYMALKIMRNKEDAEDVASDVFITVCEKLKELREPEHFVRWLNRITANKCTNAFRKKRNIMAKSINNEEFSEMSEIDFLEETNPLLIPEKALDNAETAQILIDIVDGLPEPQRLCVYYYYYEHLTIAQIAEILDANENMVKRRLYLAREKIRKELNRLDEQEGIKLYSSAVPLLLAQAFELTLDGFELPTGIMQGIWSKVTAANVVTAATSGTTAASAGLLSLMNAKITTIVTSVVATLCIVTGFTAIHLNSEPAAETIVSDADHGYVSVAVNELVAPEQLKVSESSAISGMLSSPTQGLSALFPAPSNSTADISIVIEILKHVARIEMLSPQLQIAYDFDNDNRITVNDALVVLKGLSGLSDTPVVELSRTVDPTATGRPNRNEQGGKIPPTTNTPLSTATSEPTTTTSSPTTPSVITTEPPECIHVWSEWEIIFETCLTEFMATIYCTKANCDFSQTFTSGTPLGHDWQSNGDGTHSCTRTHLNCNVVEECTIHPVSLKCECGYFSPPTTTTLPPTTTTLPPTTTTSPSTTTTPPSTTTTVPPTTTTSPPTTTTVPPTTTTVPPTTTTVPPTTTTSPPTTTTSPPTTTEPLEFGVSGFNLCVCCDSHLYGEIFVITSVEEYNDFMAHFENSHYWLAPSDLEELSEYFNAEFFAQNYIAAFSQFFSDNHLAWVVSHEAGEITLQHEKWCMNIPYPGGTIPHPDNIYHRMYFVTLPSSSRPAEFYLTHETIWRNDWVCADGLCENCNPTADPPTPDTPVKSLPPAPYYMMSVKSASVKETG